MSSQISVILCWSVMHTFVLTKTLWVNKMRNAATHIIYLSIYLLRTEFHHFHGDFFSNEHHVPVLLVQWFGASNDNVWPENLHRQWRDKPELQINFVKCPHRRRLKMLKNYIFVMFVLLKLDNHFSELVVYM